ncbi:MAG TPA: peptidylprolyl isomerase [Gemmatimonadales bacterium]|jgi:peptidyl-prolyl cis-trans isomerase D|nr:peptidylprolyl isomerase [Gemmatimonadales bacterium]
MMQAFRNAAKPLMVVVAFTFFAWLVLDLSGITGGTGLLTKTAVGKVNGQSIDARTYQTVVQQNIDARQRQAPGALGMEEYAQIRDEVWEQFVQTSVLQAEYRRRGITVSEDEIVQALRTSPPPEFQKIPEFQTDSQFDMAKYQRWLTSSVAEQYLPALESQYREQLLRSKLLRVVTADVYLSDAALWEQYRDEHEMVKVSLTAVVPKNVIPDSTVKLTDAEIQAYYKAHQSDFKRPATAFLSFVALPRLTTAADTAAARARADSLRQEIAGGAPFADVARRESSDSVSAARGGDLDEWTRGSMDPAFDSAAFKLPLNTVSQPVLSQFGFHLIEITSRKGNKAKGRHVLIPIQVSGAHRDKLDAEADSLERLGADHADPAALDTAARALKLPIGRSGPVQEGTKVQLGRLVVPDAGVWAFQAKPGATSPVIESTIAFYVFRLDSLQPEGVPPLAQIRSAVEYTARNDKKLALGRKVAQDYLKRVESGASLADAAAAMKVPNQEFGPFSRINPPLTNPVVVGTAFGLDSGQTSGLLDTKEGIYVVQSLQHTKADSAKFVKELDEYRGRMINLARQERVRSYLSALREAAKVVDDRKQVLRSAPAGQQT